jgi:hypothetical protein
MNLKLLNIINRLIKTISAFMQILIFTIIYFTIIPFFKLINSLKLKKTSWTMINTTFSKESFEKM